MILFIAGYNCFKIVETQPSESENNPNNRNNFRHTFSKWVFDCRPKSRLQTVIVYQVQPASETAFIEGDLHLIILIRTFSHTSTLLKRNNSWHDTDPTSPGNVLEEQLFSNMKSFHLTLKLYITGGQIVIFLFCFHLGCIIIITDTLIS